MGEGTGGRRGAGVRERIAREHSGASDQGISAFVVKRITQAGLGHVLQWAHMMSSFNPPTTLWRRQCPDLMTGEDSQVKSSLRLGSDPRASRGWGWRGRRLFWPGHGCILRVPGPGLRCLLGSVCAGLRAHVLREVEGLVRLPLWAERSSGEVFVSLPHGSEAPWKCLSCCAT